jgi:hypothetical protein
VDIRGLGSSKAAASYVSKYATKSISAYIWTQATLLDSVVHALYGRRTFLTFGTFRGLALSKRPSDDTAWVFLAPLDEIITSARAGDPAAREILIRLTHAAPEEPHELDSNKTDTS